MWSFAVYNRLKIIKNEELVLLRDYEIYEISNDCHPRDLLITEFSPVSFWNDGSVQQCKLMFW